ncbi:MAG: GPP34 family phosphoprotein [Mobilicoccus sp.]|nr:GPP34 family phosphoprotein [Mobilicoccus sp.]
MLIAEDLLLLLTRDDGKPENAFAYSAYGYAAGNITDLALRGRLTLSDHKDPRVSISDPTPTGEPALDAALARLSDRDGKRVSSLVTDKRVAAEDEVVAGLQRAGVIEVEPKRLLGLVGERRPVADPTRERDLRDRLRLVLAGSSASPAESTLLALLCGLDMAPKVLAQETVLSKRELKKRIEAITEEATTGSDVSAAVRRAVSSMNTAIMTAAIVPTITAATS